MPIDTSDYYPVTPGSSCDPDAPDTAPAVDNVATQGYASVHDAYAPSNPPGGEKGHVPDVPPTDTQRTLDIIATALSWILVPLLMPLYGTIMIFTQSNLAFTSTPTRWMVSLVIAAITIVVPMALVVLLKRLGVVHDLGLNERRERFIPYIITILSMGGAGLFMLYKHAPLEIGMFYIGGAVAATVCMVVNFWWKISAHAAGIAGIVALLVRLGGDGLPHPHLLTWLIVWVLLSGLMGGARVWLGRHTVAQVICGYAVGFTAVILMTLI